MLLALAMGLLLFQIYGAITWIPPYMTDVLHYSPAEVGGSSMLLGLGTIPASIFVGALAKTPRRMVWLSIIGALVSGCALLLMIIWEGWSFGALACLMILIGWGTTQTSIPVISLVSLAVPLRSAGKAQGFSFTIGYMGSILSTYLGGYVVTKTHHYDLAFIIFALSTFVLVFLVISANRLIKADTSTLEVPIEAI
jgi:predicted MFS family arabinose efflux permease